MPKDGAKFALDISALVLRRQQTMDKIVRKVVLDIGKKLVMRSPVGDGSYWKTPPPPGYVGGRFRANWQYGEGTVPKGYSSAIDASGAVSLSSIALIKPDAAGKIHFLTNNLPYARRLEDGWSRQAPHGMLAVTVVEFQSIVNRAATELQRS
jgi:hypothetical protein